MMRVAAVAVFLCLVALVRGVVDTELEARVEPVPVEVVTAKVVPLGRVWNDTTPLFRDKALVRSQLGCVRGSSRCDSVGKFLKSKLHLGYRVSVYFLPPHRTYGWVKAK